jgi:hypothetical protein
VGKQRTHTGAYSAQDCNKHNKDRVRDVKWGPYEGNALPPVMALDADYLIDRQNFSGPAKFPKARVQRKNRR